LQKPLRLNHAAVSLDVGIWSDAHIDPLAQIALTLDQPSEFYPTSFAMDTPPNILHLRQLSAFIVGQEQSC